MPWRRTVGTLRDAEGQGGAGEGVAHHRVAGVAPPGIALLAAQELLDVALGVSDQDDLVPGNAMLGHQESAAGMGQGQGAIVLIKKTMRIVNLPIK